MTTTVPAVSQSPSDSEQAAEPGFEVLAKRVDDAVAALDTLEPSARVVAAELKSAIEAVHRAGLVTIVRAMRADEAARPVLFDLVDDPVVHLLLSLHNIVRPDPTTQARKALDAVRPQLQGHGGDVELVRLDDGIAFVRLKGSCNGCSMSSVTLRNLVEQALVENVPSISGVEVVPNEPEPKLISADSLFANRQPVEDGWAHAGQVDDVPTGDLKAVELIARDSGRQVSVLVINLDQRLTGRGGGIASTKR